MVYRIDVSTKPSADGLDPQGAAAAQQIQQFGIDVGSTRNARVFFIDTDESRDAVQSIAQNLLADPVVEVAQLIDAPADDDGRSRLEIHLKPGVMDPVANSTEMAIRDMGLKVRQVRTGRAYRFGRKLTEADLQTVTRALANPVVESVYRESHLPREFPKAADHRFARRDVAIRELSDDQLTKLSREGHLFLSLEEMKAVQTHYRDRGREPTDIELETLAQTWSEHCVHKTLK
ncbi:MAG: phosphoribosylformylglycinamidine synthase subunit PurS, partial [Tepidisphaeraceae bacterium]